MARRCVSWPGCWPLGTFGRVIRSAHRHVCWNAVSSQWGLVLLCREFRVDHAHIPPPGLHIVRGRRCGDLSQQLRASKLDGGLFNPCGKFVHFAQGQRGYDGVLVRVVSRTRNLRRTGESESARHTPLHIIDVRSRSVDHSVDGIIPTGAKETARCIRFLVSV